MATVTSTPSVVQDIVDDNELRELWIVGREFERPPFFHAGKGGDMRLAKALRVVQDGRITPNSDGSYTVEGSEGRTYRCDKSCSCPQSQKGPSKHCYHFVAVALYIEWRKRCAPQAALSLPPTSVEERLAQPVPQTYGARQAVKALGPHPAASPATPFVLNLPEDGWVAVAPDGTPTPVTSTPAQEVLMPEDADAYIPEPEAPVAVAPVPTGVTTPSTSSLDARALLDSMAAWKEQRQIVTRYIKEQMQEGIDYYSLRIKGRETKPTLSKAGSEKFLAIFKLTATFQQDQATWTMLGCKEGVLCYTCTLLTRDGQVVGEGRGARTLAQDQGDINKAVKMAQKSAQIDAVLRTGALSDCFTQDLDDNQDATPATSGSKPASAAEIRAAIWASVQQRAPEVRTREAVEAWVKEHTGFALHPDNYGVIHTRLQDG